MDNFEDFLNATQAGAEEFDTVDGSFDCQRCSSHVAEARLDNKGTLRWSCPSCKYISEIKEFWA